MCDAIVEHYMPRGAGDELPASDLGVVVGIADRIDTITGCFAVGLAPTGSADPYGLRRAALGILRLLVDRQWSVNLTGLISRATQQLQGVVEVPKGLEGQVAEFLRVRFRGLLADIMKLPLDCVEAALAVGFSNPRDTRDRAEAMARLRERPDFETLAVAFKRVANILKDDVAPEGPNPSGFVEDDERSLWQAFTQIRDRVDSCLDESDYNGALQVLAELRGPVDRFFDAVLVMDNDEAVRSNRLAMLGRINDTFNRIADFRQLAV